MSSAAAAALSVPAEECPHALHAEFVDVLVGNIPQISDDVVRPSYEVVERHSVRIVYLDSAET